MRGKELTNPNPAPTSLNIISEPNKHEQTRQKRKGKRHKREQINTNRHGVVLAHAVVRTILTLTPIHEEKKKRWGDNEGKGKNI